MNSSRLGKQAEKKVREDCQLNGYAIHNSHLSRGPADFLAGKPGQLLAVQVKRSPRSGGGVGPREWNELVEFAEAFGAIPIIAFAPPRAEITYRRITGRKIGFGRQPWVPFQLDMVGAA